MELKLTNSENEKNGAKVSKLPLPITDSTLVIDLPDGQKIVIGKMTQGSVIEVATWRGVGRPDSRTSRLMLGVGTGNVNEDADSASEQTNSPQPAGRKKPQGFAGYISAAQASLKRLSTVDWSATFKGLIAPIASKLNARKSEFSKSTSDAPVSASVIPAVKVSPISENADIEAWLNKITEKATRETSKARTASPAKNPAKKSAVTKKAAPKSVNKRKA